MKKNNWKHYEVLLKEGYWLKGEIYFPAKKIAGWLGLRTDNVDEILKENPHIKQFSKEFNFEEYNTHIKIFDMVGTQLIAMEVNTEKAIEFKIAAAKFIGRGIHWKVEKTSKLDPENGKIMVPTEDTEGHGLRRS